MKNLVDCYDLKEKNITVTPINADLVLELQG